jgi:hypothetical protein
LTFGLELLFKTSDVQYQWDSKGAKVIKPAQHLCTSDFSLTFLEIQGLERTQTTRAVAYVQEQSVVGSGVGSYEVTLTATGEDDCDVGC